MWPFSETAPFFYTTPMFMSQGKKDEWLVNHATKAIPEQPGDVIYHIFPNFSNEYTIVASS